LVEESFQEKKLPTFLKLLLLTILYCEAGRYTNQLNTIRVKKETKIRHSSFAPTKLSDSFEKKKPKKKEKKRKGGGKKRNKVGDEGGKRRKRREAKAV
jgi:hypothetical protein